jgi:hypothetical protein
MLGDTRFQHDKKGNKENKAHKIYHHWLAVAGFAYLSESGRATVVFALKSSNPRNARDQNSRDQRQSKNFALESHAV